ncbi:MAG TPA: SpoIVB peptidase S55 domain-containing protein, partial [bacterium]|nr:SpoIVB peptidase S55 domain-containing protein [bacterium]
MKEIIIRFSNIRKLSAALLVIIAACASGQARASVNYMPVTEVKAGMTGYGKTVFQGLKVVKFPIKVRGIMQNAGMSGGPMILIELTGPEVDTYGGISLGMSGSPVYIKDRLIGALAVTFPETDHSLGGVTPYESMLKTADYDKPAESRILKLDEKIKIKGKTYDSIRYSSAQGDASAAPGVLTARMALAPVSVQGVSPRAFPILKRLFDSAGIDIVPAALSPGATPAAANSAPAKNIEPGSSVAVQLVRGDIDISAVGTVTAVDGKRVLMFGHPFFRKGAVNYLLADAYVHAIVRGADMPFK